MNIKKTIVGLTLSMLVSSGAANADWGDVYYCQMTNFNEITLEGEEKKWKLQKFQFKLDQTKNAMVFGSTGYFRGEVLKLYLDLSSKVSQEEWFSTSTLSITNFDKGKLLFTSNGLQITSISADCDKF